MAKIGTLENFIIIKLNVLEFYIIIYKKSKKIISGYYGHIFRYEYNKTKQNTVTLCFRQ